MGDGNERVGSGAGRRRWLLGALATLATLVALLGALPSPAHADFGLQAVGSSFFADGSATGALLAGSHPETWITTVAFNATDVSGELHADGSLKDLRVELPRGLAAVASLRPRCSRLDFLAEACRPEAAVGSIDFVPKLPHAPFTVYLLDPIQGQAMQLGFHAEHVPTTIGISISPGPPYRAIASLTNLSQVFEPLSLTLTLEGSPGGEPFLTLPSSCAYPAEATFAASSWQATNAAVEEPAPEPQALVDCSSLRYSPDLRVNPTTSEIASPSGIDLAFDAPDSGISSPGGRAAANTETAGVTLSSGLSINPPVAAGLAGCTAAELAAETRSPAPADGCPAASKLGTANVTTPLLSEPIAGAIYLRAPAGPTDAVDADQAGFRFDLDLVLRSDERGVRLAVPLRVHADPVTGRLTASLEQIPQLPVAHLELHFNSGAHAPLTTAATCGSEAIVYSLAPSSGNPPVAGADMFTISAPACDARFAPTLDAGTTSNAAGRSAPFVFELSQGAADPALSGLIVTLPPGLGAAFSGVESCPEGQATNGDCPAGSKVGYARIALGSGPEPLWVPPGEHPDSAVYLAGPYKGAPYSLVIVVPGEAGPFDLGPVVLRAPITIDPRTARASISVEGLPQILDGVPLRYRTIRIVLDRPGFIRNPTSCEPTAITGTARAADGRTAAISDRFQAADCAALRFRPKLSLRLSGAVGRNGHPGVRAVVRGDPKGAAIASANIELPAGELLDLRHLRGLCPRGVTVDRCPKSSLLGNLRLATALIDEPLEGPVYLRVPRHRLPGLSAEVRSGDLGFIVDGRTTAAHGRFGISLGSLPDIPLSEAVLNLPGGRKGIIVNSRSLCGSKKKVAATFTAHSGRGFQLGVRAQVKGRCEFASPPAVPYIHHSGIRNSWRGWGQPPGRNSDGRYGPSWNYSSRRGSLPPEKRDCLSRHLVLSSALEGSRERE